MSHWGTIINECIRTQQLYTVSHYCQLSLNKRVSMFRWLVSFLHNGLLFKLQITGVCKDYAMDKAKTSYRKVFA